MMKTLGGLARSLLNINTIWGLMIVISFVLCVVQHYWPTTTVLPAECLDEGQNVLTIRTVDQKGNPQESQFSLTLQAGELSILPEDQTPNRARPWLISAARVGTGFVLKWDFQGHGAYAVEAGSWAVAEGRLVTLESLTAAAFDCAANGFDLALGLVAGMVLLLGLMKVGVDAGIVQIVARLFYPIIRFLFPGVPKDHPANGAILMNWTTTLLGLGNAATPFGLKAMKELQSLNRHGDVATDSQIMLLGYNTAGFALLPTTLVALRKSAGCNDPFEIIGTCMVAGAVAMVTAIVMVKVLGKLPVFSVKAAVADHPSGGPPAATDDSDRAAGEDN